MLFCIYLKASAFPLTNSQRSLLLLESSVCSRRRWHWDTCEMMNYDYSIIVNLCHTDSNVIDIIFMSWQSLRASSDFPESLDHLAGDLERFYNSKWPVVSDPKDVKSLRDLCVHEHRSVVTLQPVRKSNRNRVKRMSWRNRGRKESGNSPDDTIVLPPALDRAFWVLSQRQLLIDSRFVRAQLLSADSRKLLRALTLMKETQLDSGRGKWRKNGKLMIHQIKESTREFSLSFNFASTLDALRLGSERHSV